MTKTILFSLQIILVSAVSAQSYFLNGDAISLGNDCYQLTGEINTQNGTVWYAEQVDLTEPFEIMFQMNLGSLDQNGADGICFVLQTVGTGAIGESGGGMGYLNFGTSFGIEFDTWQNSEYGDPLYDHIAMEINGDIDHNTIIGNVSGPVQMDALDINTEDGQEHTVEITWDPETMICSVYFDCTFRLSGTIDLINTVFGGQELVYFGFTAATGGAYNDQVVCLQENILAVGSDVTICTGASITLSVAGNAQGTYSWSPSDFLDDANSPTPIASPPVTTIYTVTFSDLCGNTLTENITVHVEDLIVSIPDVPELNCGNPDEILTALSNFNYGLDYQWSTTDGNIEGNEMSDEVLVNEPGTYVVEVSYQDQCFAQSEIVVTADFSGFETEAVAEDILNCINNSTTITGSSNYSGTTYSWTTIDGNIVSGNNSPVITVDAPGTYVLQSYLNEFCNGGTQVVVFANYDTYSASAGNDTEINCFSNSVILQGSASGEDALFNWNTINGNIIAGENSEDPTVDAAGIYVITVTHPVSGCSASDEVTVTENFSEPVISAGIPDTLSCVDPIIVIDNLTVVPADGNYSYDWNTQDGHIISFSSLSGLMSASTAGTYIVEVTDLENGCSAIEEITIVSNDELNVDLSQLRFPNILTANDDAKNQYWTPFLANDPDLNLKYIFDLFELTIFDRWGKKVFESNNPSSMWDGKELSEGTYYYVLNYSSRCGKDGIQDKEGFIQVVR